jgi:ABC-type multidrug transport system fused ATPase/permease subunit
MEIISGLILYLFQKEEAYLGIIYRKHTKKQLEFMRKSISVVSFLLAFVLLCCVQPLNAKMQNDIQNIEVEKLEKLEKTTTLKSKIAEKVMAKQMEKAHKESKFFKSNLSNDDLVRWILIGIAVLVVVALLRLLPGLLSSILSLVLLVIVVWLILKVLGVI